MEHYFRDGAWLSQTQTCIRYLGTNIVHMPVCLCEHAHVHTHNMEGRGRLVEKMRVGTNERW